MEREGGRERKGEVGGGGERSTSSRAAPAIVRDGCRERVLANGHKKRVSASVGGRLMIRWMHATPAMGMMMAFTERSPDIEPGQCYRPFGALGRGRVRLMERRSTGACELLGFVARGFSGIGLFRWRWGRGWFAPMEFRHCNYAFMSE